MRLRSVLAHLLFVTALLAASDAHAGPQSPATGGPAYFDPLRLYIYAETDPSSFVDPAQQARLDAIADLKKTYEKNKVIVVVEDRDQAEIQLQIVSRGEEPTGACRRTRSTTAPRSQCWREQSGQS